MTLPGSGNIAVQEINGAVGFDALCEDWNALVSVSPAGNFFMRWEWLREWWRAYEDESTTLSIFLVFRDGALLGIAPLYLTDDSSGLFPTRSLLFLGTKRGDIVSEYVDFIYPPGEHETVVKAVLEHVVEQGLCGALALLKLHPSSPTVSAVMNQSAAMKILCQPVQAGSCPYIALPHTFKDFLRDCSPTLRHNIKKARRRFSEYPRATCRRTESPSDLEKDFEELVRLHQLRWLRRGKTGAFSDNRFYNFHKSVTRWALDNGHLDLSFLTVDDRNIAAIYNITYGGKVCYYQSGLDVEFDQSLSPGLLLHSYCIERAIQSGFSEYDFMFRGRTDSYKDRWTCESRQIKDFQLSVSGVNKLLARAKGYIRSFSRDTCLD